MVNKSLFPFILSFLFAATGKSFAGISNAFNYLKINSFGPVKFWDPFIAIGILIVGLALIRYSNRMKT